MRFAITAALITATLAIPVAASAQEFVPGPYVAIRAGRVLDADLNIKDEQLKKPGALTRDADGRAGWQGEAAFGYDFGGFRLEGAIGKGSTTIDRSSKAAAAAFDAGGKFSKLDVMANAYYDLMPESTLTPYIGAGIGAARISGDFAKAQGLTSGATVVKDSAWALAYQGMAGVRYKASENFELDLGIRHQRTGEAKLKGQLSNPKGTQEYPAKYSNTSVMLGAAFKF